jgi:hypothetical protein
VKKIPRSLSKKEGGDFFVPEHLFSKQYVPWKSCLFMALFHIWAGILFLKIFKRHFCLCKMQNKSAEKGLEKRGWVRGGVKGLFPSPDSSSLIYLLFNVT